MSNKMKNLIIVAALLCLAISVMAATIDMSDNHLTSGQKLTHTFWNDTVDEIAGGVNNVTTGQITDGTIVNADISATADILQSKIDNDARAIDADKVDGFNASLTPTASTILPLDTAGDFVNNFNVVGNNLKSINAIYNNYDGPDGDSWFYFYEGSSQTGAHMRWDNTLNQFRFSHSLYNIDADTLDTLDSTAFGRLATANTWTAAQTINATATVSTDLNVNRNLTVSATLQALEMYLIDSATRIYKDGSNNIVFKDAVVTGGSKTLTQLATDGDSTHHYSVDGIAVGGAGPVYTTVNSSIDWRSRNICILVYKSDSAWSTTAPTVSAGTNPFYIPLGNSGQTFELNTAGASVLLRANSTSGNLEWGGGGWNTASMLWVDLTK